MSRTGLEDPAMVVGSHMIGREASEEEEGVQITSKSMLHLWPASKIKIGKFIRS